MAIITVPNTYDLESIAIAAGNTDPNVRTYHNGQFTVDDVTQQNLDDALAAYVDDPIGKSRKAAKQELDVAAENARLRYITPGAGQAIVYQEKAEQASDYVAAGYPSDLTSYPFIQAEVNATGKTATNAADDILAQRSVWIATGAQIEEDRLSGKKSIDDAVDSAGVIVARDNALSVLDAI